MNSLAEAETNLPKTKTPNWNDLALVPEIDFASHLSEHVLISKVISSKPLNKNALHTTIKAAWSFVIGLAIEDLQVNTFHVITFPTQQEKLRVLEQRPWNIRGFHMLVRDWPPGSSLHEINLKMSIFWVQIHGLPLEYMTNQNAEKIARKLGNFIQVEKVTGLMHGIVFRDT